MACEICQQQYVPTITENDGKPHACIACGKSFSLKIQLKRHMAIHENGMAFVCIHCEKIQDSQSRNSEISKKNAQTCEKCARVFKTKRLLIRHSCEHALIKCDKCDGSFTTIAELLKHSVTHKSKKENIQSYFCIDCNKSFSNSYLFEKHKASHIKHINKKYQHRRFKCKSCDSNFTSKEGLYNHSVAGCGKEINVLDDLNPKKHICEICDKSFTRKSTLDGHLITHFADKAAESGVDDCSDLDANFECDEKEEEMSSIEMCLPKLKNKQAFPCEVCERKFTSRKRLDNHLQLSHVVVKRENQNKEQKKYTCLTCNKIFLSKLEYKKHNRLSHNTVLKEAENKEKKKYTCRTCNEIFLSKMDYKKHKVSHNPVEPNGEKYKCKTCGNTFAKKKHLKKHLKKHFSKLRFNDKPKRGKRSKDHACDNCGKRFSGKHCLQKHIAKCNPNSSILLDSSASKDKKLKKPQESICPYCNQDFTGRKFALTKHKLTHTPEVCGICDARFEDRPALREHLKSTHVGTEEAKKFVECSQKVQNVKNISTTEGKVEYIYLVLR